MKATPFIYITPHYCLGSHANGWRMELSANGLPAPAEFLAQLPDVAYTAAQLSLLISDNLLHPLRVIVENKIKKSELPQYLGWKLKRYLPWPIDQVALRYLPLAGENAWLTFSLPSAWLEAVCTGFREKGVSCGFMSGAFATLLEQQPRLRNHTNLCFFEDTYMLAELDAAGNYLNFTTRRLPFCDSEGGKLDIETLHHQDLATALSAERRPLQIFNLDAAHDAALHSLVARLRDEGATPLQPKLNGNAMERLHACLFGREVWA